MRARLLALTTVAALGLALPAAAGAAEAPAKKPSTTTTTAAKKPKPRSAKLALRLERVDGARRTVLRGSGIRVRGTLRPYVAGQRVTVRLYAGQRKLSAKRVAVRRAGGVGTFLVSMQAARSGRLTVRASHRATAKLGTAVARSQRVRSITPGARPGAKGPAVRWLQRKLRSQGYTIGRFGVLDGRTQRAVLVARKVMRMRRTSAATASVFRGVMAGRSVFKARFPRHGRHAEGDISRQVLALFESDGKTVHRLIHTSTGAPSTPTIRGSFRVYRKSPGTNAKGMIHSVYFIRGYAVHGYKSVPVFNASHGCLRVPPSEALSIYRWFRFGTRVDTYR